MLELIPRSLITYNEAIGIIQPGLTSPVPLFLQSIVTKEGDKIIDKQTGDGKTAIITREFTDAGINSVS